MTKYQFWESDCKNSSCQNCPVGTFSTQEGIVAQRKVRLICKYATLAYEFEAENWDEACKIHHEKQGWKPYIPFDESIGQ